MFDKLQNFTVIDSIYGRFIVNRYCSFQAEALVKTGKTHIESELNNMRAILKTLPENAVIVDGGANIGFVTVPFALEMAAKHGSIISFEPQRMLFNALAGTLALNNLNNVRLHQKALGAEKGVTYVPRVDYGQAMDFGMVELTDDPNGEAVEVVTLDSLGLQRLDFFKLDVEGYEIRALQGARRSLEQFQPWCWIEYWKTGKESIVDCFKGLDYKFYLMDQLNMLCVPVSRLEGRRITINAPEVTI